jgi:leucyl aminopeptidase
MTDFAAMLIADSGQAARAITLVDSAGLTAWLGAAGERGRAAVAAAGFAGKAGEVAIVGGDVPGEWSALVGKAFPFDPWALAAAAEKLPPGAYRLNERTPGSAAFGWLMAQHRFDRYRAATANGPKILVTRDAASICPTIALAEATALVRDLVDTPAGDMDPAALAAAIRVEGERFGATVTITIGEALRDGFPAVHAVGRAAAVAPRLVDLAWGDPSHPKLTLVGKGVTFDSGGLDIKPASGMRLMKKDMGGAAHALALARLVMAAKLPVRLRLIVPAVENAISGNAFRPGDVLATRAGVTVEIGNTDAEGRLILADALTLAQEDKPALLLDMATLTGAARTALGPDLPALFSHDDALAADLLAGGIATGDQLWRMPLWAPYAEMIKSGIADIDNSGEGGFAGCITAALFLDRWAHIDLFAWNPTARPGRPKGGAATGLRAIWAMIERRFGAKQQESLPV